MKNTLNIFCNKKIITFLNLLIPQYELIFLNINDINRNLKKTQASIIIINNDKDANQVFFEDLSENYLIISNLKVKNINFSKNATSITSPLSISNIRNVIESFVYNLKLQFHDISIDNEKIINLNDNSVCYLTKIELEILKHLIRKKETSKNYIKKNILKIKSNIETNSLESHLTRIRKKMNKVNTSVKIQTKNEKLSIII
tara:strand:+ start:782 stop:1384 length:603 start_codon:yes stop_codon:yes gene_type:complete